MDGMQTALDAIDKEHYNLFGVELAGLEIIFCLPSLKATSKYLNLIQQAESYAELVVVYEHIFRRIVQDQWLACNASDIPAGIPETIAKTALSLVNVNQEGTIQQLLSKYRDPSQLDMTVAFMSRVVCQVFSGYTFEILENLEFHRLVYLFVQAEKALLDLGALEKPYAFTSSEKSNSPDIHNIIRKDQNAYREFDSAPDPRSLELQRRLREGAVRRAKQEEANYLQQRRQAHVSR